MMIVLRKQITNELHVPEDTECIRIDYELHAKLFLQVFLDHFYSGFSLDKITS